MNKIPTVSMLQVPRSLVLVGAEAIILWIMLKTFYTDALASRMNWVNRPLT